MNQFVSVAILVLAVAGNALGQELQFGFRPNYTPQRFQRRQGFAAPQQQFRPSPQAQNQFNPQRFRPVAQQQQFIPRQTQNFAPSQGNFNQPRPTRVNNNRPLFRNNVGGLQPPRQVQQQTVVSQFNPRQNFRNVAPVQQQQQFQQPQNLPRPNQAPVANTQAQAFTPIVNQNARPAQVQQPLLSPSVPQPLPPVQPQPSPQFANTNNVNSPAIAPQPAAFVAPSVASFAPQTAATTTVAVPPVPAVTPTFVPQPAPILPVSNQIVPAPLTAEVATTVVLNNVTPAPIQTTRQPLRPVPLFPLALDGNNVEANAGVLPLQSETSNLELQFPKYPPFLRR